VVINGGLRVLIGCFVGYIITYAYVLLPPSDSTYQYIPFSDVPMSLQSHVYYICERLRWIIFAFLLHVSVPRYSKQLFIFFTLECLYLIDYLVFFNNPIAKIRIFTIDIPLSFSFLKACLMCGIIVTTIIKENGIRRMEND